MSTTMLKGTIRICLNIGPKDYKLLQLTADCNQLEEYAIHLFIQYFIHYNYIQFHNMLWDVKHAILENFMYRTLPAYPFHLLLELMCT